MPTTGKMNKLYLYVFTLFLSTIDQTHLCFYLIYKEMYLLFYFIPCVWPVSIKIKRNHIV